MRRDVMVKMDVSDIQYPDQSFDAIYCSHVFQDVPDDNRAIRGCFRVLRSGGWAILNVPISTDQTHTNDTPDNVRASWDARPDEHVRAYGLDYAQQLEAAGFSVEVVEPAMMASDDIDRHRMGIDSIKAGYVHFVTRP
jgi:ubiquinone/menaquinone biosynthesis C-methylase UbiE